MQDLTEYTLQERPETVLEIRSLSGISLLNLTQEAGSFPDPATDAHNLILVRSGSGSLDASYGNYEFRAKNFGAGDIAISPTKTYSDYKTSSPVQLVMFELPGTLMRSVGTELNPHFLGDLSGLHSGLFRSNEVMQRMLNMWRSASNDERASAVDGQAQAIDLAETLIRLAMNPRAIRAQRTHLRWHVRCQVLQYVDAHLGEDMPLAKLANIASLSEHYFLRAFKAEMGITPHQYIIDQRIQRAKHLLKKTNSNLADVALQCGFASHQHMATVFNQAEGRAPSAFRRATRYFHTSERKR
jgi:AraC family transcriptional regulator